MIHLFCNQCEKELLPEAKQIHVPSIILIGSEKAVRADQVHFCGSLCAGKWIESEFDKPTIVTK